MTFGEEERPTTAPGVAYKRHATEFDCVEERHERTGHRMEVVAKISMLNSGVSLAGEVDCVNRKMRRQTRDSVSVREYPLTAARNQDDGWAISGLRIVESSNRRVDVTGIYLRKISGSIILLLRRGPGVGDEERRQQHEHK